MSGGGGGSGKIAYAAYMETAHGRWLNTSGADTPSMSVVTAMNTAQATSPWATATAYNPAAPIAAIDAEIAAFAAILAGIVDTTNWATLFTQAMTSIGARTPLVVTDMVAVGDASIVDVNDPLDINGPTQVASRVVNDAAIADVVFGTDLVVSNFSIADKTAPTDLAVTDLAVADITAPLDLSVIDILVADRSVTDITDTSNVLGITEALIVADTTAFSAVLEDEIDTKILPRYRRGMQDINAVVSSAYAIGEAIIRAFKARDVAKHSSQLRLDAAMKNADIGIGNENLHLNVKTANLSKNVEIARSNLSKDVEIGRSNLSKNVEVGKINLLKNLDTLKINQGKNVEVGKLNKGKDLDVGKINISKALETNTPNLSKEMKLAEVNAQIRVEIEKANFLGNDLEYNRMNLSKSVELAKANLAKNLEVAKTNILKTIDVGKANLTKNVAERQIKVSKDVEISKGNMVKNIQVGDINLRSDVEYKQLYIAGSSEMLKLMMQRISFHVDKMRFTMEANRIEVVALKEQNDMNLQFDENDALWDLECFKHGNAVLSSIVGAAAMPKPPPTWQTALGASLQGAATIASFFV